MPSPTSIINALNGVLNQTKPAARLVKKRIITRTGGDPLIGRTGTVTYSDTILSPQPYFSRLGRDRIPGRRDLSYDFVDADGRQMLADDYEFIFSPTSITREELENPDVVITLTDADNNVETLNLMDVQAPTIGSAEVAFIAYYRSSGEKAA